MSLASKYKYKWDKTRSEQLSRQTIQNNFTKIRGHHKHSLPGIKVQKKGGEELPTTGQHCQVASQRFSFTLTRYLPGIKVEGKAWHMRTTTSRACNNDHRSPHAPQPGDPWPLSTSPTPPASKYNAFHWKGSCVAYKTPVLLFACYHITILTKINKFICPFMNIRSCLLGGGGPDRMMCRLLIRREAPSDQNCGSRW